MSVVEATTAHYGRPEGRTSQEDSNLQTALLRLVVCTASSPVTNTLGSQVPSNIASI